MAKEKKAIFRASAYDRYLRSKEEAVLPEMMAPRVFHFLWGFLLLLAVLAVVAFRARVPIFAQGVAGVVRWDGSAPFSGQDLALVVALPAEHEGQLRVGLPVRMRMSASSDPESIELALVEPQPLSPEELHARFQPSGAAGAALAQPSAIALAPWNEERGGLEPRDTVGSVFPIEAQVGTKRLASLLPGIGRFFDS